MVTSTLDIWNRALSACRAKGRLSGLNDNSLEREVCEEWYDVVLGTVQEAVMWDSCAVTTRPALLRTRDLNEIWQDGDPEPPYRYLYALPEDYLRARQLSHGEQFFMGFSPTDSRRTLSTNAENAVFSYSKLETDPTRWSSGQQLATIYGLAAHIAFPLSGLTNMVQKNITLANAILEDAQTNNANNSTDPEFAPAPWHVARGAAALAPMPTFIYPLGQTFAVPAVNATNTSGTIFPDAVN